MDKDNKQPTLLLNGGKLDIKSPVFQPRPGWGGKIKKWLYRHFTSKLLPIISFLVLAIGLYIIIK